MIPKIIHFIWFNDPDKNLNPYEINRIQNDKALASIGSWIMVLKDYQFMYWNNSNINLWMKSPFFKYMYEHKKYAFCSDYVREWVLYNYGGIYLDTDVTLANSFDKILHLNTFFGLECFSYKSDDIIKQEYNKKYRINDKSFESAIMGSYPNNELFIKVLNNLDNIDVSKYGYDFTGYIITHIIVDTIKSNNYNYKVVNSIKEAEECEKQNILPIFNAPRFDRWYDGTDEQDYGMCDHHFFNSWC